MQISINFMCYDITKICLQNRIYKYRYLGSSPSDEDLELTVRSATLRYPRKKCLIKIECADLDNEANMTRNAFNLSFNFVVATSCPVTPYYSLSLSRVSSTSHAK